MYRRKSDNDERALFGAQMLTEMAGMSCDDGLVMQLHAGSHRNHNAALYASFGADRGADIPMRTDYVARSNRCLINMAMIRA